MKSGVAGSKIFIYLDKAVYSVDGIVNCIYLNSEKYAIQVNALSTDYEVIIEPHISEKINKRGLDNIFHKIQRDFINFNLQDTVKKRSTNISARLTTKSIFSLQHGKDSTAI